MALRLCCFGACVRRNQAVCTAGREPGLKKAWWEAKGEVEMPQDSVAQGSAGLVGEAQLVMATVEEAGTGDESSAEMMAETAEAWRVAVATLTDQ